MRKCLLLPLFALLALNGCASGPSREMIGIPAETLKPIHIGEASGPIVDARVRGETTVVTIHGARFVCQGHRGYLGQISARRGWISVGQVTFRYDGRGITMRGARQWARFQSGAKPNLIVQQSGRTSRSVFK